MRKLLLLIVFALFAAILLYRQRLFLRDPLGKMYVNNVQVDGSRVFINYSNDVMVMRDGVAPLIVQGWDGKPGAPASLACFWAMACVTEADRASKVSDEMAGGVGMTNREVSFSDGSGKRVRVVIR